MMITTVKTLGNGILERIGGTPLVRLDFPSARLNGVQILGKAEWANPGGSVKDRAASAIVADAMARGLLGRGRGLLDATSGNTGIAYAMLGAALDFPVTLCMPSNVSPERKLMLAAYGADIVWTDPAEGSDGAIRRARGMAEAEAGRFFYADQYSNEANWKAHYRSTANEIWDQSEGQITHFVAGLGTSGTFMGTTRRLRELNAAVRCISMQPDSPFHGLEGLKHMESALVPAIYDPRLADENLEMATERAYAMAKELARHHGILVGVSAAAAVAAAVEVGEREARAGRDAVVVTILCDSAEKYLQRTLLAGRLRMLSIHYVHYEALRSHGEETYPHECCGVLLGRVGDAGAAVRMLVRAGNTRTDSAHNRYQIAPQELVKIQRQARGLGLDIVGFYHSHPDHPARWSVTDFAEAHWLGCSYVITSVEKGRAMTTNSFLLRGTGEDDKSFQDESIEINMAADESVTEHKGEMA